MRNIGVTLTVCLLAFWPVPATAMDYDEQRGWEVPGFCDSYADRAVKAAQRVQKAACGMEPVGRFTTDRKQHYVWCRRVMLKTADEESEAREYWADRCSVCRAYAKEAVQAAVDNILYSCGFTGNRWGTWEEGHFNYCKTVEPTEIVWAGPFPVRMRTPWERIKRERIDTETGARAIAIAQCKENNVRKDCVSCHTSPNKPANVSSGHSPAVRTPVSASTPARELLKRPQGSGGAYLVYPSKNEPKSGTSAVDRLSGSGNALDAIKGGSGGADLVRNKPCPACATVQSSAPAKSGATAPVVTSPVRQTVPRTVPDFNPNYGGMSTRPRDKIDVR